MSTHNICFGGGIKKIEHSYEYHKHMFMWRNKKKDLSDEYQQYMF